jgi:serpin B
VPAEARCLDQEISPGRRLRAPWMVDKEDPDISRCEGIVIDLSKCIELQPSTYFMKKPGTWRSMNTGKTLLLMIALICAGAVSIPAVTGEVPGSNPDISFGMSAPYPIVSDVVVLPFSHPGGLPSYAFAPGVSESPAIPVYPSGDGMTVPVQPDPSSVPSVIPPGDSGPESYRIPSIPFPLVYPSGDSTSETYPLRPVPSPSIFPPSEIVSPFNPVPVAPAENRSPAAPESEHNVVDANNRFALELYAKLSEEPEFSGSNLFFSPFSLSSALALTYEGARGSTADEIRSVFHFPEDNSVLREGFADINSGINAGDGKYTLRTANALWAEKTYAFLPGYVSTARLWYDAPVTNLDFKTGTEDSRVIINEWVENQTERKIRDLLPPGSIDASTRLVITNAVYFKGTWVKQFDPSETHEGDFMITPGVPPMATTTRVQMMQRTDREALFGYAETDLFQALQMPYAHESGKQLSMLVLLPKGTTLAAVEDSLIGLDLSSLRDSLTTGRVDVYFPKVRLETTYSMNAILAEMGMPTAFTDEADLSGMDGTRNLSISDVVHKAYVDVNEEGTEAAAATGVIIGATGMLPAKPIPVFRADHPFVFLIVDDETGNILFMGRVVNPNR